MSGNFQGHLRLTPEHYHEPQNKILERDGWKCQRCGRRDQLHIHHLIPRSQTGPDCEENLIVLCCHCHRSLHLRSVGSDDRAVAETSINAKFLNAAA